MFKCFSVLFVLIFTGIIIVGSISVLAAHDTVIINTDTNVDIYGVSRTLTLKSGGEVAGFTVYSTYLSVDMESGSSLTIVADNGYMMTSNPDIGTFICDTPAFGKSQMTLASTTTQTVIITPSATTCSVNWGGGGGGSSSTTTPTTPTTPPTTPTGMAKPEDYGLTEGDLIRAQGDFDIFIINQYGYKRLFLNPVIFNMYGHLGGWSAVKTVTSATRDAFVTSKLFRYVDSPKVYELEVTGEDTGKLHWINMTGESFLAQDGKADSIFTINKSEFNWYPKGAEKTSL